MKLVSNKSRLSKFLAEGDTPENFLKRNHEIIEVIREFLKEERAQYIKSLTSLPLTSGEAYGVSASHMTGRIQAIDALLLVLGEEEI